MWGKKGTDGILRIVKDQSRYLPLRSPDHRRNFVVEKTRCDISRAARSIASNDYLARCLKNTEQEKILRTIREIRCVFANDDGSYVPTQPTTPSEEQIRHLNLLHHLILYDVSEAILGKRCPKINEQAWFMGLGVPNFMEFALSLARDVVEKAANTDKEDRTNLYADLAKIAVSLQHIIATRWYVSEVKIEKKTQLAAGATVKEHQEVAFFFLAFRAIVLYMLPQCPWKYGVQQVA